MCVRVCVSLCACVCVWGGMSDGVFTQGAKQATLSFFVCVLNSLVLLILSRYSFFCKFGKKKRIVDYPTASLITTACTTAQKILSMYLVTKQKLDFTFL